MTGASLGPVEAVFRAGPGRLWRVGAPLAIGLVFSLLALAKLSAQLVEPQATVARESAWAVAVLGAAALALLLRTPRLRIELSGDGFASVQGRERREVLWAQIATLESREIRRLLGGPRRAWIVQLRSGERVPISSAIIDGEALIRRIEAHLGPR